MPRYAVAASGARSRSGRPSPPWHAADLLDEPPLAHAGEQVVSLCGLTGLRVFPLDWAGLVAANGCRACREAAASRARSDGQDLR